MEEITDEELRRQIINFLREIKDLIQQGHYQILGRIKNYDSMIALGITERMRDEFILSLAVENYSSGPMMDEYKPGNIWVFGKELDSTEIYIKLKIVTDNHGNEMALCMSFHPSEYRMKYPFRR